MEWKELKVYLEKYRSVFNEDFPLMMASGVNEIEVIKKCIEEEKTAPILYPDIFGAMIGFDV